MEKESITEDEDKIHTGSSEVVSAVPEAFMVEVDDRSTATLLPIIQRRILPGTTVMSDQWRAYCCLGQSGFNHETVNHSLSFVDPQSGAHT